MTEKNLSEVKQEISLGLRTAAAFERAAKAAEERGNVEFEEKMISAGASAFGAFKLAAMHAPEYQGRKLDDAALNRIYQSTKPRPWWDTFVAAARGQKSGSKDANRDWAKRLIQWHLDPVGARTRRAQGMLQQAASQKRLREKQNSVARGMTSRPKAEPSSAVMAKFSDRISEANAVAATAGRAPATSSFADAVKSAGMTKQDAYGEINRIKAALDKMHEPAQFNEAVDLLKAVARDLERMV